jgi:hypothetical protein
MILHRLTMTLAQREEIDMEIRVNRDHSSMRIMKPTQLQEQPPLQHKSTRTSTSNLHLTRTNQVHQGLQTEFIPNHDIPRRPRQQNLHIQTRLHTHCKYRYVANRPTINGHRNQALLNPANSRENLDMGDSLHEIISSAPETPINY